MATPSPLVLREQTTPTLLTITLNDPDRLNAMGEEMARQFAEVVQSISRERIQPRAIILTGAGKAFSAGGDLAMLERKTTLSGEENRLLMLEFYTSFLSIVDLGIPVIAAINGAAIGAGLCLASACDIRIASNDAKLGFTFAKIGLHPGMGATYFLPRVVGESAATELLLTGRVIDASRAKEIGLVSTLVEREGVLDLARTIAGEIGECGPEAVKQLRASLRTGAFSRAAALEREAACQAINYASAEFKEGVRATIEKRRPNYQALTKPK